MLRSLAAVSALHQAIKLLINAGNFRQAADREKEVSIIVHVNLLSLIGRSLASTRKMGLMWPRREIHS